MLPEVPERLLEDRKSGGLLSPLQPVGPETVAEIAEKYPGISAQYLSFIQNIGVGQTTTEFTIHLPYSALEIMNAPSFQIYHSPAYQNAFPSSEPESPIKEALVCIADPGASWHYCLDLSQPGPVFVIDMFDSGVLEDSADFFSFIGVLLGDQLG